MQLKNNKGFTLIELLITIALLAVISIISFVSINAIINKNKDNECNSTVNNIKLAVKEYVSDNRYKSGMLVNSNISITAQDLFDSNYLSGEIINPYTKDSVSPSEIKIDIELYSDKTIKTITITDSSGEEIFNNCRIASSGGGSGTNATTTKPITVGYEINYILNGGQLGTNAPSSALFDADIIISNPKKTFKIILDKNGTGATLSATSVTKAQTFAGWSSNASAGLGEGAQTGRSVPNQSWLGDKTLNTHFKGLRDTIGTVSLTANWTVVPLQLPKVTKNNHICGWNSSKSGTTIEYRSEASYTPSADTAITTLTLYAVCIPEYKIVLNKNDATNTPAPSSVMVAYNTNIFEPDTITTLPERKYTVSGFGLSTARNSNGATVSSTAAKTSSAQFNGWYTSQTGGSKVLDKNNILKLESNVSGYTDANGRWIKNSAATLYARFVNQQAVTLPTITKEGYKCGWTENSSGTVIQYQSGANFTPTASITLYGVCELLAYKVTNSGNNTYADSLANALSMVQNGGTITARKNNQSGAVTNTKNITFNTATYEITLTGILTNNGTMTINGGGTITGSVVLISNNGALTTSNVTITNNNSDWIMYSSGTYTSSSGTVLRNTVSRGIAFYKGTINIDGGTIDVGMAAIAKDAWSTNNGTIKISGGTIIGGEEALYISNNNYTTTVSITGGTLIGTNYYGIITTNSASVNLTMTGGTVSGGWSGIGIWGGATVTGTISNGIVEGTSYHGIVSSGTGTAASLTISGGSIRGNDAGILSSGNSSNTFAIEGGKITGGNNGIDNLESASANYTISSGIITGTSYYGIDSSGTGTTASVTISGGSISGGKTGISILEGATVTGKISDGIVKGTSYHGIDSSNSGTTTSLTISGGSIVGKDTGILSSDNSSNTFNIQDGTITGGDNGIANLNSASANYTISSGEISGSSYYGITTTGSASVAFTMTGGSISGGKTGISILEGATVTGTISNNARITGSSFHGIMSSGSLSTASLKMTGGSISGGDAGILSDYNSSDKFTIQAGTITGGNNGIGIWNSSSANYTITGGTITGSSPAIHMSSPNATVTLGTNGGIPSTTTPKLIATNHNYAINFGSGTWKWYDGVLYGKSGYGAYSAVPTSKQSNCSLVTVVDSEYGYKSYLVKLYTLTVNPNGGNFNGSTDTVTYKQPSDSLKVLPEPTKVGYTFNGWTKSGAGTVTKYGTPKFDDEEFASSNNRISVYNNAGGGTVTHQFITKSSDNPMESAIRMLRITTNGSASPGLGGFFQRTDSYANAVFYHVIVAKIPVGYTIVNAQNATGNGRSITWLTSQAGTGKFEVYIYKHQCGNGGTFSTFGHVYLNGPAATSSNPVSWDVAYANMFDATSGIPEDATQVFTYGEGDGNLTAKWTGNTYTATFYYNSNTTAGSTTLASTTVSCTVSNAAGNCNVTIPEVVRNSVGTWNNAYAGLSTSTGNMTQAVASNTTVITLTGNVSRYAFYRTNITVYRPSSTTACTTQTMYRNQWFRSNTALATTVISSSSTGTTNANPTMVSGYLLESICTASGDGGSNCEDTMVNYAYDTGTTYWTRESAEIIATFKYSNNATGSVASTTRNGYRDLYCIAETTAATYNSTLSSTFVGTSPYGTTFLGWANDVNKMTTATPTAAMSAYYAVYRTNVSNYYYNSGYTSRTIYRNGFMGSDVATTYSMVLSTSSNGTSNYSTAVGFGSASWVGLAESVTTNVAYSTVASAATSTAATLYTIYQFNVTYAKGSYVSAIGATSGDCKITTSTTACNVTLPTITANAGYTSVGWDTTNGATTGTAAGASYSLSTNNQTLYANAKLNGYIVTFVAGSNVTDIGTSSSNCPFISGTSSCAITLPSITPVDGYVSVGWSTTSGATSGAIAGCQNFPLTGNTTLYANAILATACVAGGSATGCQICAARCAAAGFDSSMCEAQCNVAHCGDASGISIYVNSCAYNSAMTCAALGGTPPS